MLCGGDQNAVKVDFDPTKSLVPVLSDHHHNLNSREDTDVVAEVLKTFALDAGDLDGLYWMRCVVEYAEARDILLCFFLVI